MSQAKCWCFTINADEEMGDNVCWPIANEAAHPLQGWQEKADFEYLIYSVESGAKTGHIHLQGLLCFTKRKRLSQVCCFIFFF